VTRFSVAGDGPATKWPRDASTSEARPTLFKPWYTEKGTGQRQESPNYQIIFRDHKKTRRSFTGTPRQQETNRIAQFLLRMVESRRTGGEMPSDAKKWFENLDAQSRKRIVDMDLIDPVELSADIPLIDHLDGQRNETREIIRPGYRQALGRCRGCG